MEDSDIGFGDFYNNIFELVAIAGIFRWLQGSEQLQAILGKFIKARFKNRCIFKLNIFVYDQNLVA